MPYSSAAIFSKIGIPTYFIKDLTNAFFTIFDIFLFKTQIQSKTIQIFI